VGARVVSVTGAIRAGSLRLAARVGSIKAAAVRGLRWRVYELLRRVLRALGYHLVRANYYSPIPDVSSLPDSTWSEPSPMPGLHLDLDSQLRLIDRELAEYVREFSPPRKPPGNEQGFYLENPFFGAVDAELLYAMVRHSKPSRLLELGSGFSTLVAARAGLHNEAEAAAFRHTVVDPFPTGTVAAIEARIELKRSSAADLDLTNFTSLRAGDLLMIDTTHTVKVGGEVNFLLLEALPRLAAGVIVQIHDFFRPFEYPRLLYERFGVYWQEQYLLQALLVENPNFDLVIANYALSRLRPDRLRVAIPSLTAEVHPSSLWVRRIES
jgi:Methyltransferase domain